MAAGFSVGCRQTTSDIQPADARDTPHHDTEQKDNIATSEKKKQPYFKPGKTRSEVYVVVVVPPGSCRRCPASPPNSPQARAEGLPAPARPPARRSQTELPALPSEPRPRAARPPPPPQAAASCQPTAPTTTTTPTPPLPRQEGLGGPGPPTASLGKDPLRPPGGHRRRRSLRGSPLQPTPATAPAPPPSAARARCPRLSPPRLSSRRPHSRGLLSPPAPPVTWGPWRPRRAPRPSPPPPCTGPQLCPPRRCLPRRRWGWCRPGGHSAPRRRGGGGSPHRPAEVRSPVPPPPGAVRERPWGRSGARCSGGTWPRREARPAASARQTRQRAPRPRAWPHPPSPAPRRRWRETLRGRCAGSGRGARLSHPLPGPRHRGPWRCSSGPPCLPRLPSPRRWQRARGASGPTVRRRRGLVLPRAGVPRVRWLRGRSVLVTTALQTPLRVRTEPQGGCCG